MIRVEPVSVATSNGDKKLRSYVKSNSLVKSIRAWEDDDEAIVDIQYRRTQSTSEISIRQGAQLGVGLTKMALVGAVYQLLLEGRSRIEYFAKRPDKFWRLKHDSTMAAILFSDERLKFKYEGSYPLYTKKGQSVDLYGYLPDDGLPDLFDYGDAQFRLSDMSTNPYRLKNKEYYEKLPCGESSYWSEVLAPMIELVEQKADLKMWDNKKGFADE